jgi:hypothetical protein
MLRVALGTLTREVIYPRKLCATVTSKPMIKEPPMYFYERIVTENERSAVANGETTRAIRVVFNGERPSLDDRRKTEHTE